MKRLLSIMAALMLFGGALPGQAQEAATGLQINAEVLNLQLTPEILGSAGQVGLSIDPEQFDPDWFLFTNQGYIIDDGDHPCLRFDPPDYCWLFSSNPAAGLGATGLIAPGALGHPCYGKNPPRYCPWVMLEPSIDLSDLTAVADAFAAERGNMPIQGAEDSEVFSSAGLELLKGQVDVADGCASNVFREGCLGHGSTVDLQLAADRLACLQEDDFLSCLRGVNSMTTQLQVIDVPIIDPCDIWPERCENPIERLCDKYPWLPICEPQSVSCLINPYQPKCTWPWPPHCSMGELFSNPECGLPRPGCEDGVICPVVTPLDLNWIDDRQLNDSYARLRLGG